MKELMQFWPQFILLAFYLFSAIRSLILGGIEIKPTFHPAKSWIMSGCFLFVLIQGGFFRFWGGAQFIWLILNLFLLVVLIVATWKWSEFSRVQRNSKYTISNSIIVEILALIIYWWGGFFDGIIAYYIN